MIYEIPQTIKKTNEIVSARLETITENLKGKSSLYFTGCGTAFFSALLGANVLTLGNGDGLNFDCVQALELTNHHPLNARSGTFGISHSGITKTTIDAVQVARSKGSYTIGVTHFAESPLSKAVDETLVVGNSPDKSRCHTKCYAASAIPLTQIGIELLKDRQVAHADRLSRIRDELLRLPGLAESVLAATDSVMRQLAEKNYEKHTFYFAGTGASYPNALEAALKVMETSYVPAQGFQAEQLLHGPWVSLDDKSLVFVIATEERTRQRNRDLIEAATRLGATVIPLMYEGEKGLGSVRNGIELPHVDEQVAPYLSIIPLYLFAYYLSLRSGNNPDYLRYLDPNYWEARTIIFPPGTH